MDRLDGTAGAKAERPTMTTRPFCENIKLIAVRLVVVGGFAPLAGDFYFTPSA